MQRLHWQFFRRRRISIFLIRCRAATINYATNQTERTGGYAALHDAICLETVDSVGAKLCPCSREERPSKVLVLIMTDGLENASRTFHAEKKKERRVLIKRKSMTWSIRYTSAQIKMPLLLGESIGISAKFFLSLSRCYRRHSKLFWFPFRLAQPHINV